MKILITGGAGFIGCNFCNYYLKTHKKDLLVCLDALTYAGNLRNLKYAIKQVNFKFVKGSICDKKLLNKLFKSEHFDAVINFAAESHVDNSIKHPEIFYKTNILGVVSLLEMCKKYGNIRFHQVSTDEVYGDLPLDRPDLLFSENSQIKPSSPYSSSKASADLITLSYYKTFGVPITISRCSNNYGPYQFPEKLIPLSVSNIVNKKKIQIYGDGLNVRDWLFVDDHCKAIDLIIHNGKIGEIYNIGGNNEKNNLQIAKIILKEFNCGEEMIEHIKDRPGHDRRYAINASKIEKELGWKPIVNFEEGIKQTIKWYRNNKKWIEEIKSGDYKKIDINNL